LAKKKERLMRKSPIGDRMSGANAPGKPGTGALSAERIARDFGPMVSSLAYQFFGNHEEAQDAAQEAWLEILKALPGFRGESSLSTWIHTVAWRRMLRMKRREKLRGLRDLRKAYHAHEPAGPAAYEPETALWVKEVCRNCMTGVLFCLDSRQRLAFLLRQVAELEYDAIAAILKTTAVNARKMHSRSRALVARFMRGDCAFVGPKAKCAYGMDPWIRRSALDKEFAKLGSFAAATAAFRIHPALMPGPDYWKSLAASPT
jgi:RNA polymerase sigma factor (sigma-70 family)